MRQRRATTAATLATLLLPACRTTDQTPPSASPGPATAAARPTPFAAPADPFDAWLRADFPVADGFDPPVADSRELRAIAHGRVVSASGTAVSIEHVLYDNHERRNVRSVYEPVEGVRVGPGTTDAGGSPCPRTSRHCCSSAPSDGA
jgi:hypothetical protein